MARKSVFLDAVVVLALDPSLALEDEEEEPAVTSDEARDAVMCVAGCSSNTPCIMCDKEEDNSMAMAFA